MRRWPLDPPGAYDGSPILAPPPPPPVVEVLPAGLRYMPNQQLYGTLDGVNKVFEALIPFLVAEGAPFTLYRNGIVVPETAYVLDPAARTVTFEAAPLSSDLLIFNGYVQESP